MRHVSLLKLCFTIMLWGGCPDPGSGTYSSEEDPSDNTGSGVICPSNASLGADNQCYCDNGYVLSEDSTSCVLSVASVGTSCIYDSISGENPTNQCPQGMTCFIVTRDSAYTTGLSKAFWEDQFTNYLSDGTDEGICTYVGTPQSPPTCPSGTVLKSFETNVMACVRTCATSAECPRATDVCDVRYADVMDFQNGNVYPHCVRPCELDIPDCVRSADWTRSDLNNAVALHLYANDLSGASLCNQSTGICNTNPGGGLGGLGERCYSASDCIEGTSCWQAPLLGLSDEQPGFCGGICKPDAQQPASGCPTGHACQAGFTFGHGDPLDTNTQDTNGFLIYDASSFGEAGGFCFPTCTDATGCGTDPDIKCGQAQTQVFGSPWNNVSMCLQSSMRAGN